MKLRQYTLSVILLISGEAFANVQEAASDTGAATQPAETASTPPTITALKTTAAEASSPAESERSATAISPAQVTMTASCENYEGRFQPSGNSIVVTGSVIPFVPILADLVGNVAGAGLNALSTAIANASKAKAVGAEGTTNFEFYTFTGGAGIISPTIGDKAPYGCLNLRMSFGHTNYPQGVAYGPLQGFGYTDEAELVYNGVVVTDKETINKVEDSFNITPDPTLIVEVEIHRLRDGFYL